MKSGHPVLLEFFGTNHNDLVPNYRNQVQKAGCKLNMPLGDNRP
jgi:hypothetical protein